MSDEPEQPRRSAQGRQVGLYPGGAGTGKAFLPAFPRRREFASLLQQHAVDALRELYPSLEVRKRLGETGVTAYFEEPGFSKTTRWAVECLHPGEISGLRDKVWPRFEPLVSGNEIDRLLVVTEHELTSEDRAVLQALPAVDHVTVARLRDMLNAGEATRDSGGNEAIPTASGFVRVDHNDPAVEEARIKRN